ncbi:AAA domain-containing protein [Pedobacter sp. WC2423]|uniref:AAA domain-containing protein n=1 Tax=Pedobacter sp. WC2423 TaxID=3234142 RepID=UPI003465F878
MIPKPDQLKFYEWQLYELSLQWEQYLGSKMRVLLEERKCFLGKLHGIDKVRGNVLIKFPKNRGPRLDMQYCLYLPKDLNSLNGTFSDFAKEAYSTSDHNVSTLYYMDNDCESVFVGIGNIPIAIFDFFVSKASSNREITIVLGEPEPPYAYLQNLLEFTKNNGDKINPVDNGSFRYSSFGVDKVSNVITALENQETIIIQGPPGTGKSTVTADLISKFGRNKKVCVAALANKALIEIAQKDGLKNPNLNVFKTNLTVSEKNELTYLEAYDDSKVTDDFVLLTTYFKLSNKIKELTEPIYYFDLLIIEEASQAFYTTILAFKYLAQRIIIIGDPKQLNPIVLNSSNANKISKKIYLLINGMNSIMGEENVVNYLLKESFRLNTYNTTLTNFFYEGKLVSKNQTQPSIKIGSAFQSYFNKEKTTQILLEDSLSTLDDLLRYSSKLNNILHDIHQNNTDLKICVLVPFRKDVVLLHEALSAVTKNVPNHVTVETIDRVQGLTVDICFLILRLDGPANFIFDSNRFNVATSRSKHYNLIVTDKKFKVFNTLLPIEVKNYINYLTIV